MTLNVTDQQGTVAAGGSGAREYTDLIKKFEALYPNVTVKRQTMGFDVLVKRLPLMLSSNNVPDVTETDQGYDTQGRLVKAGLLQPLDEYYKAWNWGERQGEAQLLGMRVRDDGTHLGEGKLYGMAASQSLVGMFYNRAIMKKLGLEPPTTMQEFEDSLAKAKAAGEVPIQGADGDAQATDWGLMTAAAMNADTDHVRDTYLGRADGGFDTPEMMAAIKAAESWGDKGYLPGGLPRPDLRRRRRPVHEGRGPLLHQRHVVVGRDQGRAQGRRRVHGAAARPGRRERHDRGAEPAVGDPREGEGQARRGALDRLRHEPGEHRACSWRTATCPATKFDAGAAPDEPLTQDVLKTAESLAASKSQLPFEWAVPTFQQWQMGPGVGLLAGKFTPEQYATDADKQLSEDRAKYGS